MKHFELGIFNNDLQNGLECQNAVMFLRANMARALQFLLLLELKRIRELKIGTGLEDILLVVAKKVLKS